MNTYKNGPLAYTSSDRQERLQEIAAQIKRHFGEKLLALGYYGSLGRGSDGPFSDIEMHAVISGESIDQAYEWSTGPWKAEVDIYSPEVFQQKAGEMNEFWPITHGAYVNIVALYDSSGIFPRAAAAVFNHPNSEIETLIREVLIGDLYEVVGKARNAIAQNRRTSLAAEAADAARYAACLMGLSHKRLFTSSQTAFSESLQLPDRPAGLDEYLWLILHGDLRDNLRIAAALDVLWDGIEAWAVERNLHLHQRLEDLLNCP